MIIHSVNLLLLTNLLVGGITASNTSLMKTNKKANKLMTGYLRRTKASASTSQSHATASPLLDMAEDGLLHEHDDTDTTRQLSASPGIYVNGMLRLYRGMGNLNDDVAGQHLAPQSVSTVITFPTESLRTGYPPRNVMYFNKSGKAGRSAAGLPGGSAPRTIVAWFKKDGDSDWGPLMYGFHSCYKAYGWIFKSNALHIDQWCQFNPVINNTQDIWYHIAFSWDGSKNTAFVNGAQVRQDTPNSIPDTDVNGSFAIGGNHRLDVTSDAFSGFVADVAIFNRALTASEVSSIYENPTGLIAACTSGSHCTSGYCANNICTTGQNGVSCDPGENGDCFSGYCDPVSNTCISQPSQHPSKIPSLQPSKIPSLQPSKIPSQHPSEKPSVIPSHSPSFNPSFLPSLNPSVFPSTIPTNVPTIIFTTKYPSPDPSSVPSITPFVDQTTTLYVALSGNLNDLENISPANLQNMATAVADYLLSLPLGLKAATVDVRVYGASKAEEQTPGQIRSFIRRRLQLDGAIRLVIDVHSTTRVIDSAKIDERMSEVIRGDTEGFSQAITSSVDGSLDTLTGLIASLEDIHPSTSPSSLPSVEPSSHPSRVPSSLPSSSPTLAPSSPPSFLPSAGPSLSPSSLPSLDPSSGPSLFSSVNPSSSPILYPSSTPSSPRPSYIPSIRPSVATIGENNVASSLYPSFKTVNMTKTEFPSVTPSNVPFNASKTPNADDGRRGTFYVRGTTLAGACAAASAAAASASAGSAAAGASASSAPSVSSSDDMRADDEKNDMRAGDENSQESVTQDKTARVEGGPATLSNQKIAAKRSGYSDNDKEDNVDQTIKSSGAKQSSSTWDQERDSSNNVNIGEDEMGRSYNSSQPEDMSGDKEEIDSNQGVSSAATENNGQCGSNNDNSIAGGDIEQGTLSDQSEMKRTNVTNQVEFQDTGSSDMQYSDAGLSEVSKNQPVAEVKSARVEGGAATLSNQVKNKGIKNAKNKNAKPVKKSNQLSEIKADAPKMSMWEKLQVASGSLEDGYDSSWKDKYNRNKQLSSKTLEKVDKLHQNNVDSEDAHVVGISFSVALAIFKLSSCGDLDGRERPVN